MLATSILYKQISQDLLILCYMLYYFILIYLNLRNYCLILEKYNYKRIIQLVDLRNLDLKSLSLDLFYNLSNSALSNSDNYQYDS